MWSMITNRHTRPMNTVVLDDKQKINILSDMNEYLSPAAAAWYAGRGILLWRGYLFHGPPGTEKTSLSFALAGVFGLDIYVMPLLDSSLTEQDVLSLFSSLPTRCIILLEDIDTAGVARSPDTDEEGNPAKEAVKTAKKDKEGEEGTKGKEENYERDNEKSDGKASEESGKRERTTRRKKTSRRAEKTRKRNPRKPTRRRWPFRTATPHRTSNRTRTMNQSRT
ncbi:hypothetical protein B0T18DRAFT_403996 [Schizothecium vesticola]|uniref:ATPase AAA-type core domain-containing protein n=1 Tax=Schizothecium vesticola TaxID=314040 RepID=A0AA40F765_9PEZI|nr:hypothetical protein B0T18DRAFT_403996 [Schizothecium vesticola]